MSLVVTLHVFSGRPDPAWALSEQQAQEFVERLRSIPEQTSMKASGTVDRLGYRGFSVSIAPEFPLAGMRLVINEGIVDLAPTDPSLFDRNREVEAWLLSTAGEHVDQDIREEVGAILVTDSGEAILPPKQLVYRLAPVKDCIPKAIDAAVYNPAIWNTGSVQIDNNCYNYANNQPNGAYAQPGHAHFTVLADYSCPQVEAGALADGLVSTPNFNSALGAGEGWYVAFAARPNGKDYHWFRQDADGCWSHKPGSSRVRSVDSSGNVITDPRTCDRGRYTIFCGYMITKNDIVIS